MRSYREIGFEDAETGFAGYLVVEASERSLSFGGTRIDPCVTREMVAELAENMSLKLAVHGSPVGGAKAGLRAPPDSPELPRFLRRFAQECRDVLTSTTILGKDMGAQQWMLDEIYRGLGLPQLGLVRGQHPSARCPERLFELDGYIQNMTGQGIFWAIEQVLGGALRDARVLIQGFGVVGAGTAWHLARAGARVVGVSDREKSVLAPAGFDVEALLAAKGSQGLVAVDKLPAPFVVAGRDALLTQQADVLVLAAGSYLVDGDIASGIQAPVVIEAANLALLPEARTRLHERAVRVVPDVVANSASAAMVGHQIASGNGRDPRELWEEIEAHIKQGTDAVERAARALHVDSKNAFRQWVAGAPSRQPGTGEALPSAGVRRSAGT